MSPRPEIQILEDTGLFHHQGFYNHLAVFPRYNTNKCLPIQTKSLQGVLKRVKSVGLLYLNFEGSLKSHAIHQCVEQKDSLLYVIPLNYHRNIFKKENYEGRSPGFVWVRGAIPLHVL